MAVGVAARCRADWGLAATGVAGPDPQDGHPVGQVFVAVAQPAGRRVRVRELALGRRPCGDPASTAARGALELLADALGMPDRAARR